MKTRCFAVAGVILVSMIGVVSLFLLIDWIGSNSVGSVLAVSAAVDAPIVAGVEPDQAPNDLDTPIVITGMGFTAGMTITLGDTALSAVGWVNSATLTATLPWGLNPGVYDINVTNPDGQSGSLTNAFTVTQGIGVWTTGGPYGGDVPHLYVHPTLYTTLYADTGNSVFRSRDAGENWELVNVLSSVCLAMSPAAPDTLYVSDISGYNIYRSDDAGDTWLEVSLYEAGPWINTVIYPHPTISGTVYMGVWGANGEPYQDGALFKSTNWGETWITQTQLLTDAQVLSMAFDPVQPLSMYIGTVEGNVFQSTDGGEAWNFIGQPEPGEIKDLAVNPFDAHEVWAVDAGHLWKRTGSAVWEQLNFPYWIETITFDPLISGTLWIGTSDGSYRSTDGGQSWDPLGALTRDVLQVALAPSDPQTIYLGYRGEGVYRSGDSGVSWQEANHGLTGLNANRLAITPDDSATVYVSVFNYGLLKTRDGGASWRRLPIGFYEPWFVMTDPTVAGRLYVGVVDDPDSGVSYSEDGGEHWQHVTLTVPLEIDTYCNTVYSNPCQVAPLDLAGDARTPGQFVLAAGFTQGNPYWPVAGGIYTSDDYGLTWNYVDANVGHVLNAINTLAYDPFDPQVIYAGLTGGPAWDGVEILRSGDGGQTWQTIFWAEDENGIQDLVADPFHPGRLFRTYGGIDRSDDGGLTWVGMPNPPFGQHNFHSLAFVPGWPVLYAATSNGLYRTDDGANSWQTLTGPLARGEVSAVAAARDGERVIVYASTAGSLVEAQSTASTLVSGGIYRLTALETLRLPVYLPFVVKK